MTIDDKCPLCGADILIHSIRGWGGENTGRVECRYACDTSWEFFSNGNSGQINDDGNECLRRRLGQALAKMPKEA